MSKQANKTVIGAFVVGAVVLLVSGVLLLGGGKFFEERDTFVIFFQGSVQGLNVGAPVKFRGVNVGLVTEIKLSVDPKDLNFLVPVYFELIPDSFTILGGKGELQKLYKNDKELLDVLIKKHGLKGQLQMQSLVTGQLFINLDFYPETPIKLVGADPRYYEIPSQPTTLQILSDTFGKIVDDLRKVSLDEVIQNIADTSQGLNDLVNSQTVKDSLANFNQAVLDMQRLARSAEAMVKNVDSRVAPLAKSIEGTMQDTRKLVANLDGQVGPLATDLGETIAAARQAFTNAEQALSSVQSTLSERSPLRNELIMTLNSLSEAARSLNVLADYLQRHPEALLTGKTESGR